MAEPVCPDQETLKLLLLGRLQEPEHRRWESHLLACADCAASAETIHAADSLTEAIARRCRPRGDVYVSVVLLESNGTIDPVVANWTPEIFDAEKDKMTQAMAWWENMLELQESNQNHYLSLRNKT